MFALCETVCGSLQQSVAELALLLDAAPQPQAADHERRTAVAGERRWSGCCLVSPAAWSLVGALLAAIVSPWFLLLVAFVGVNQWLYVIAGDCPASLILRRVAGLERGAPDESAVGPIGRLGRFTATHVRAVVLAWIAIAVAFGAFAPRVETALSGAGWQANGSQSVQARSMIQQHFAGQSSSGADGGRALTAADRVRPRLRRRRRPCGADPALRSRDRLGVPPRPGVSLSRDGHTAIVMGGAARNPTQMVAAADRLKGKLHAAGSADVTVNATGASAMWSDFNTANRTAMMRSELFSWPVTLAILVLAFGSLVAAGLPLMLTITGLVASAGVLFLGAQLADISIWAMNFALMFALALGIDYALFIVARFRGALFGSDLSPVEATAVTMDTAGKAVLFSG